MVLYRKSKIRLSKVNLNLSTELIEEQAGGSMSHRLPIIENITLEDETDKESNR